MSEGPDRTSIASWAGRGLLITVAAVLIAISTGAITLPVALPFWSSGRSAAATSLATDRSSADQRWASGLCTNVQTWKHELTRDGTSLDLGFGVATRVENAIAATNRMLDELNTLGLPPGAQTAQARAEIRALRAELITRVRGIESVAGSVAAGNIAAIGTLLSDLQRDKAVGAQLAGSLSHVLSVDLGLSLVETRACRELVGIPI
jgi:hypothetical protein